MKYQHINFLNARIEALEKKLTSIGEVKPARNNVMQAPAQPKSQGKVENIKKPVETSNVAAKNTSGLNWDEIVSDLRKSGKMMLYTNLINRFKGNICPS